jgi:hypothetical protein
MWRSGEPFRWIRSVCERGGLTFNVDCRPLGEEIYVDHDMWEKVVLNLLSNAFKYTRAGGIAVRLRRDENTAVLSVSDTGIGIAANEIARLFERFHRVEGAQGRTHEGTGIGLALVQELVKLHGGSVTVESLQGRGSTFTVRVPFGISHLPKDRIRAPRTIASTAVSARSYVDESLRSLSQDDGAVSLSELGERGLLGDDNAIPEMGGERPKFY